MKTTTWCKTSFRRSKRNFQEKLILHILIFSRTQSMRRFCRSFLTRLIKWKLSELNDHWDWRSISLRKEWRSLLRTRMKTKDNNLSSSQTTNASRVIVHTISHLWIFQSQYLLQIWTKRWSLSRRSISLKNFDKKVKI